VGGRHGAGDVKTVLVAMLVGAVLGLVVASFIVPPLLSWYNEPGAIAPLGRTCRRSATCPS
jgi:hypothetical protein